MVPNIKNVALVTGASSGIGRAIAERLARDGFFVLAHFNRNAAGAEQTVQALRERGGQGEALGFDVRDRASIETALKTWLESHPDHSIEVLVNNAGIHTDNLAGMLSDEAFDDVLRTNTYGPFYLMRFLIRKMLRNRSGCIINISSLAGQTGNAGQINYAASKAALIAMTKSLAMEVGSRGIRVNAVAPGLIQTEMIEGIPQIEAMKARIPLQRVGRPEEVAGAVSFLASGDSSYITGHTLSVNGGLFPT